MLLQGWLALAIPTHRSSRIGTETINELAENLKIPLYCKVLKYHRNANAAARHCFMDL